MSDGRTRRWPTRLAKISPLISAAILCAILFSLPVYMIPFFLDVGLMFDEQITPEMRAGWIESVASQEQGTEANLWGDADSFDTRAAESWALVADVQEAYVTAKRIEPLGISSNHEAFAPIAQYERDSGARVWAWTLVDSGIPSVVASAVGNPETLAGIQREVDLMKETNDPYMPRMGSVTDYLWSNSAGTGARPPVNTQLFEVGGGGGIGGDTYSTMCSTIRQAGALWYVGAVLDAADPESAGPDNWALPSRLQKLDPLSDEFRSGLEQVAQKEGINVFVMGPLTTDSVPLRVPPGADPRQAERVGETLWPGIAGRAEGRSVSVADLTPEQADLVGGEAAVYTLKSMYNSGDMGGAWFEPQEIAPQTILYLAVFGESPVAKPGVLTRVWREWQRFVSMWFPYLIGGAFALLLVSLVLAPTVFVTERRRAARERMAAELEEMRRDAHDKVYNRLSALSKRVAVAGDEASAEFANSLGDIANDIRGTVGELQGILGESAHHTDAVLTNQPLADQIASVCNAQSARLGVEIDFAPAADLPEVSGALGWDLQCVAEEAITNAVRHGAASRVVVSLATEPDGSIALTIVDNGSGSSVLSAGDASGGSTGLAGIQARLAKRGGTLEMVSGSVGTSKDRP